MPPPTGPLPAPAASISRRGCRTRLGVCLTTTVARRSPPPRSATSPSPASAGPSTSPSRHMAATRFSAGSGPSRPRSRRPHHHLRGHRGQARRRRHRPPGGRCGRTEPGLDPHPLPPRDRRRRQPDRIRGRAGRQAAAARDRGSAETASTRRRSCWAPSHSPPPAPPVGTARQLAAAAARTPLPFRDSAPRARPPPTPRPTSASTPFPSGRPRARSW